MIQLQIAGDSAGSFRKESIFKFKKTKLNIGLQNNIGPTVLIFPIIPLNFFFRHIHLEALKIE